MCPLLKYCQPHIEVAPAELLFWYRPFYLNTSLKLPLLERMADPQNSKQRKLHHLHLDTMLPTWSSPEGECVEFWPRPREPTEPISSSSLSLGECFELPGLILPYIHWGKQANLNSVETPMLIFFNWYIQSDMKYLLWNYRSGWWTRETIYDLQHTWLTCVSVGGGLRWQRPEVVIFTASEESNSGCFPLLVNPFS